MSDSRRDTFNRFWSWAAGTLAIASLVVALIARHNDGIFCLSREIAAGVVIGAWVVLPPLFFWVDWVFYTTTDEESRAKHTHDLARNIWVALVLVLTALFGVNPLAIR